MKTKLQSSLLILSCFVVMGCTPTKDRSQPVVGTDSPVIADFKKTEVKCVDQLKERMIKGDFILAETKEARLLNEVKAAVPFKNIDAQVSYSLSNDVKNNTPTSIGVSHKSKKAFGSGYSFSLSIPDKDANYLFSLRLTYNLESADNTVQSIDQSFKVDANCQSQLIQTTFKKTKRSDQKLTAVELNEYADGRPGSFSASEKTVDLPTDGYIIEASMDGQFNSFKDVEAFVQTLPNDVKLYKQVDSAPYFFKIKFNLADTTTTRFDPIAQKDSVFKNFGLNIEPFGDFNFFFSESSEFSINQFGNGPENWAINQKLFNDAVLSRAESSAKKSFEISDELTKAMKPVVAEFLTNKEFSYENLASYWTIESKEKAAPAKDGLIYKYTLISQAITATDQESDSLVTDSEELKTNADLQESKNLQISIAPVQAMIKKLKSQGAKDRLTMARMIGKMVTETITYDYQSLADSTIHALNTTDVLERKTGVCQHFANLYATLARGVGLPARFITGYHLSNGHVGAHAWNEIEIRAGVWVPIEPQSATLNLNPVNYFPIVAGGYMETMDPQDSLANGLKMMIDFKGKVLNLAP